MYIIVQFVKDKDVAIVPSNWIIEYSEDYNSSSSLYNTYWPSYRSPTKINKLVQGRAAPESDWSKYDIKIMESSGIINRKKYF